MCHFKLRNRKRRPFIFERDVRQNVFQTQRWLQQFLYFRIKIWCWDFNLVIIEVWITMVWWKSRTKDFFASSVKIPYDQNLTSTLKLRSALFSWLVWVISMAMRCQVALSGGFPLQIWWLYKPRKELPSGIMCTKGTLDWVSIDTSDRHSMDMSVDSRSIDGE